MATEFPTYALTTEGSDAIKAVTDPEYATAAQGSTADTAVQPGDLGTLAAQDDISVPGDITATGTASSSTYLRGDGAWATPAGGGSTDAADINIADSGGLFTATEVEAALAEVKAIADTATQPGDLGTLAAQDDIAVPADITATGTASSSTFLRGDGAWATPSGSGITHYYQASAPSTGEAGAIWIDSDDGAMYYDTGSEWVQVDAASTASQPLDADLTAIAALTTTAYGRALLELADEATFKALVNLEIGTDVQAYDADTLKADTTDTLTAGFDSSDFAAGTKSTGTYTPAASDGNFQVATNGGAHTLAPPATSCSIVIHYTNNGSAGTITTSGFTAVTGDDFTTTDAHEFVCVITKINDVSVLNVTALQ